MDLINKTKLKKTHILNPAYQQFHNCQNYKSGNLWGFPILFEFIYLFAEEKIN